MGEWARACGTLEDDVKTKDGVLEAGDFILRVVEFVGVCLYVVTAGGR